MNSLNKNRNIVNLAHLGSFDVFYALFTSIHLSENLDILV